jgi:cell division protein FtsI (penicillin-binding protein 3)
VVAFVLSLFAARLVQLQGIDENHYAAMAVAKGAETITLEAPRAPIYDRNGVALASTVESAKLVADPTYTKPFATQIATVLHHRLGIDYLSTVALLRKSNTRYVELARHVKPELAAAMVAKLARAKLPGVYSDKDTSRVYPAGDVAANIVGFLGADGTGLAGMESALNSSLAGKNGSATFEVADGQQLPLANNTVTEPVEGTGVRLTLDEDLQFLAQRRLAEAVKQSGGSSGVAVVMDVKSGQLLALADYPTFDPASPQQSPPADYGSRALQDAYEPGSVEKVLTFGALIDAGYVTPRTEISVPPTLTRGGHVIHDYFPHGTLHLTAAGVLAKSSNIGTVRAAEQMPKQRLYRYLHRFGLGTKTSVGLGGESPGLLPAGKTWLPLNRDTIAFGQGLSVNAVQMTAAVAAVANGGTYVQPSLIEGRVDSSGDFTAAPPPARHRVISRPAAAAVGRMMEQVVGPQGTAPAAAIAGYRVAGKTGTAQRVGESCGCYDGSFTVSFAGFAPADNPRFVVYVVVQQPTDGNGGGGTGGPVFHDLMSAALQKFGVPPTGARSPALRIYW